VSGCKNQKVLKVRVCKDLWSASRLGAPCKQNAQQGEQSSCTPQQQVPDHHNSCCATMCETCSINNKPHGSLCLYYVNEAGWSLRLLAKQPLYRAIALSCTTAAAATLRQACCPCSQGCSFSPPHVNTLKDTVAEASPPTKTRSCLLSCCCNATHQNLGNCYVKKTRSSGREGGAKQMYDVMM
jgi:hypothetical protein